MSTFLFSLGNLSQDGITEWLNLPYSKLLLKTVSPRTGCQVCALLDFELSQRMETPQPLWRISSTVQPHS